MIIDTNNKPLMLLIVMNVLLFIAVFWLIGMMMGRGNVQPLQTVAIPLPPVVAAPEVSTNKLMTLEETIADELAMNPPAAGDPVDEPEMVETVRTVNVYYDGDLVRMEESDNRGNMHVQISNTLKEAGEIAPQDEGYVAALRDLEQGKRERVSRVEVTREAAEKPIAVLSAGKPGIIARFIDRFNKVDVSEESTAPHSDSRLSLIEQIENVVSAEEVVTPAADTGYVQASLKDYVETLDVESMERANEMRTIKVKRGDSLWVIAKRAYGTGFEYPRIYKANPHLRDPDLILEGEILRVPL